MFSFLLVDTAILWVTVPIKRFAQLSRSSLLASIHFIEFVDIIVPDQFTVQTDLFMAAMLLLELITFTNFIFSKDIHL